MGRPGLLLLLLLLFLLPCLLQSYEASFCVKDNHALMTVLPTQYGDSPLVGWEAGAEMSLNLSLSRSDPNYATSSDSVPEDDKICYPVVVGLVNARQYMNLRHRVAQFSHPEFGLSHTPLSQRFYLSSLGDSSYIFTVMATDSYALVLLNAGAATVDLCGSLRVSTPEHFDNLPVGLYELIPCYLCYALFYCVCAGLLVLYGLRGKRCPPLGGCLLGIIACSSLAFLLHALYLLLLADYPSSYSAYVGGLLPPQGQHWLSVQAAARTLTVLAASLRLYLPLYACMRCVMLILVLHGREISFIPFLMHWTLKLRLPALSAALVVLPSGILRMAATNCSVVLGQFALTMSDRTILCGFTAGLGELALFGTIAICAVGLSLLAERLRMSLQMVTVHFPEDANNDDASTREERERDPMHPVMILGYWASRLSMLRWCLVLIAAVECAMFVAQNWLVSWETPLLLLIIYATIFLICDCGFFTIISLAPHSHEHQLMRVLIEQSRALHANSRAVMMEGSIEVARNGHENGDGEDGNAVLMEDVQNEQSDVDGNESMLSLEEIREEEEEEEEEEADVDNDAAPLLGE
jgi:hypothetical protein